MQIEIVTIHNFRSVTDITFNLYNYSMLIGANNAGKTNVIDAIRVFYDDLKFDAVGDMPKCEKTDDECWIDVQFTLTSDEAIDLKGEYLLPDNKLKVRKYLKTIAKDKSNKVKSGIFAYLNTGSISDEHFYGAKNVQQGKLGEIVYIPAVSTVSEHMKMSGPSILRDVVTGIISPLVESSIAYQELEKEFQTKMSTFKSETTSDGFSLSTLQDDISESIKLWNTDFAIEIRPVSASDIIRNLLEFRLSDQTLSANGEEIPSTRFGQGFQRHLIFSLFKVAAKYKPSKSTISKDKDFSPSLTLLLFEEPEAFLHPTQQHELWRNLNTLVQQEGYQVVVSSHSANFVSNNTDDITKLIRLSRNGKGQSIAGQISPHKLKQILTDNQKINPILSSVKDSRYHPHADDLNQQMEDLQYFMYLDPLRCGMFFSGHVLLVEGPTERVFISLLLQEGKIKVPDGGLFVLDCMGLFNIHRFMNIMEDLHISHSVVHDTDNKEPHKSIVSTVIKPAKNAYTKHIIALPKDIEDYLNVGKPGKPHRKPQHMVYKYKNGAITQADLNNFITLIESTIN